MGGRGEGERGRGRQGEGGGRRAGVGWQVWQWGEVSGGGRLATPPATETHPRAALLPLRPLPSAPAPHSGRAGSRVRGRDGGREGGGVRADTRARAHEFAASRALSPSLVQPCSPSYPCCPLPPVPPPSPQPTLHPTPPSRIPPLIETRMAARGPLVGCAAAARGGLPFLSEAQGLGEGAPVCSRWRPCERTDELHFGEKRSSIIAAIPLGSTVERLHQLSSKPTAALNSQQEYKSVSHKSERSPNRAIVDR